MLLILFLPVAVAASSPINNASTFPIVHRNYGDILSTTSPYRPNIKFFKGIPYAAPPTGELRWKPPVKPEPWSGTYNATEFSAQCPQALNMGTGLWTTGPADQSEDCLYMNIWTPTTTPSTPLPVYIWAYSGRVIDGSGDVVTYDGSGLASQDIITITFNFRLGPLGFLAHPLLSAESPHNSFGNYGILDIIAALEWVQANIASFGGDPARVTVGGQSSGSSCSLDMMYSPLANGLASGIIAESCSRSPRDPLTGSLATSYRQKDEAESSGLSVMTSLNASTLSEMRALSVSTPSPEWRLVLDGYVLPHTYASTLSDNTHPNIPILTGNNKDESGAATDPGFSTFRSNFPIIILLLYPANDTESTTPANNAFWADLGRVSTWSWALDWYAGGATAPVYTYSWDHAPPGQSLGAFHGSEMYYVFGYLPYNYPDMPWTERDFEIERVMVAYWSNFIKYGDSNGEGLVRWEPSGEEKETMLTDGVERRELMLQWLAESEVW
ncbi:carboxylesterase [Aspergillus costaricaensis CBS 115574]|uniref:Carboxylesterase n=1 Tax=Aspergillus costaricaensis CBS 115574 TaxID=1448317 RepID=A0ACD1IAH9_9EURO|nr:carboxylesterase [Aspergillus costaricaensis CBS 115574]RAK87289.1 carboxylesterase [Aspergillus costaricaensis CBS 115574]